MGKGQESSGLFLSSMLISREVFFGLSFGEPRATPGGVGEGVTAAECCGPGPSARLQEPAGGAGTAGLRAPSRPRPRVAAPRHVCVGQPFCPHGDTRSRVSSEGIQPASPPPGSRSSRRSARRVASGRGAAAPGPRGVRPSRPSVAEDSASGQARSPQRGSHPGPGRAGRQG